MGDLCCVCTRKEKKKKKQTLALSNSHCGAVRRNRIVLISLNCHQYELKNTNNEHLLSFRKLIVSGFKKKAKFYPHLYHLMYVWFICISFISKYCTSPEPICREHRRPSTELSPPLSIIHGVK